MQLKKTIAAAAVTLATMGGLGTAQAAPVLALSSGLTNIICADGDAACDSNPLAGVVTFIGAVGAFTVNVSTGLNDSISPTNLIDLNSVNIGVNGGTLTIGFSETGYTHNGVISGAWGGTLSGEGASVSAAAYAGLGNILFQQDVLLGSLGPFGGPAFASTFTSSPLIGPYSLTQIVTITSPSSVSYSGDFELKVPEPSGLALVGAGLLGVGMIRRRRKA